jgi:hypothetical protein
MTIGSGIERLPADQDELVESSDAWEELGGRRSKAPISPETARALYNAGLLGPMTPRGVNRRGAATGTEGAEEEHVSPEDRLKTYERGLALVLAELARVKNEHTAKGLPANPPQDADSAE